MKKASSIAILVLTGIMGLTSEALSQARPYIGYVYPAGGRQGTTFQVRLGGQNLDDVGSVQVTGAGVSARIMDYYWRMNNQEQSLLNEQLEC